MSFKYTDNYVVRLVSAKSLQSKAPWLTGVRCVGLYPEKVAKGRGGRNGFEADTDHHSCVLPMHHKCH